MAESINGRQQEAPRYRFSLKELIKGEDPKIIAMIKRQMPLIALCIFYIMCYVGNRYSSQKNQILIENLKREVSDLRYQSLNVTSDVSARSKASYIENLVGSNGSGLETMSEPPFTLYE